MAARIIMRDLGPDPRPPIESWSERGARDRERLLRDTLPPAVLIQFHEVRQRGPAERQWRGRSLAGYLGTHGAAGIFPGRPGRAATYLTRLAEALAILAHQPGGVTAFGLHFEVIDQ